MTHAPRQSPAARAAFTLIEAITILVLLGSVAALLAPAITRTSDQSLLRHAAADLRHLDRTARLLAPVHQGVILQHTAAPRPARFDVIAEPPDRMRHSSTALATTALPTAVTSSLSLSFPEPSDRAGLAGQVRFDRAGRARDYIVRLATNHRRLTLAVSGDTGHASMHP